MIRKETDFRKKGGNELLRSKLFFWGECVPAHCRRPNLQGWRMRLLLIEDHERFTKFVAKLPPAALSSTSQPPPTQPRKPSSGDSTIDKLDRKLDEIDKGLGDALKGLFGK